MTQSAWPFSGQTVSEAQFRAWARQAFGSRIYQGLTVSTSTTGRQLTVSAGLATVDGCAYMSDSAVTLDVDANTTGQARRVYAVLRLDPTATPQIQLATVNGPAGGGAASFTQTDTGVYEFPLGYATVTAGQSGGWSSATSAATALASPRDAPPVVAQTLTFVDTAASGNPRLLVKVLYDPPSGQVCLFAQPTNNLTGLAGGRTYQVGIVSSQLRPPEDLGLSSIHIATSTNDEVYLTSAGAVILRPASATTPSTGHYPRGSISYPARGGRNMASFG
jgi:hypothetical protein